MPMYSRDRDILLAETIERILNKLEEDNQAALDEAGLFRRMQNTYRAASGRVGDFTSGRFKNNKDGRANLDKLKDISPKRYYYFLDTSNRFTDKGYYSYDSFARFPKEKLKREDDIVIPIPHGVRLEDVSASNKTGARYFEFRFKDLADTYSLNPDAKVARMSLFLYNLLTGKWDRIESRSISVNELLKYQEQIEDGILVTTLSRSHRAGFRKKLRDGEVAFGKHGRLGSGVGDKTYTGRYSGTDLTDPAMLKVPGMQKAFDEYSERMSQISGADIHPSHSQAYGARDWTMSENFAELGKKVKQLGGNKLVSGLYPKVAAEAIALAYPDIIAHSPFGSLLNSRMASLDFETIETVKDVLKWLASNASSELANTQIRSILKVVPSFIPSGTAFASVIENTIKHLITFASAAVTQEMGGISVDSQSPSSYWKLSDNMAQALRKIEAIRSELVQKLTAASTSSEQTTLDEYLEELDILASIELIIHYNIEKVAKAKKVSKPEINFRLITDISSAAKLVDSFIVGTIFKGKGVSTDKIEEILDAVLDIITRASVLESDTRRAIFNTTTNIKEQIFNKTSAVEEEPEDIEPEDIEPEGEEPVSVEPEDEEPDTTGLYDF